MALVSGSSSYDFNEFMEHTTYINGYTASHPAIQSFWTVVNDFSRDAQKQLLSMYNLSLILKHDLFTNAVNIYTFFAF